MLVEPFSTDLTVTIDVDYTPPADFDRPSVNDFRAGSGPVTLTCQVEGATGSVTYQWTSTCGNCFASGTSPLVTQQFLRAGLDDGTHTCTATDSDGGETGSADFVMRIIGMFVSSLLCTSISVTVAQFVPYLWLWFLVCSATVVDSNSYKDTGPEQGGSRKWRSGFLARLYRKAACI